MIKNNWHTHTKRCGHAIGEDEEYVIKAIQAGIKILGFSDHAPYKDNIDFKHRMPKELYQDYIESINNLKEKYKDKIDIYLGLEVENYIDCIEELKYYRKTLDYCILGQHGFDFSKEHSYYITKKEDLIKYCELIEKACEIGLCDYIAHPDVCLWSYPRIDETVIEVANRIADVANKYHVPIELNCGSGVRSGEIKYNDGYRYPYPTKAFFEIFAKKRNEIIIGLDIHNPDLFLTDEYLNRALSVIQDLRCNVIEDYDLISNAYKRRKEFGYLD